MPTHFKGTEEQKRALNAFITLQRASDTLNSQLLTQLDFSRMTISQFGALEALFHLGPLCQHELAAKLLKSGGNMTMVINNLVKRGWARRVRQKNDRRIVRVHLTAAGRRQIEKVLPAHVSAIVAAFSVLTARDQEELRRICRKFKTIKNQRSQRDALEGESHDSNSTE